RGRGAQADQPADGGGVHDRPAAALSHVAGRRLAAVEGPAQVDGDHVVPLVGRHRVDVADLADARATDEDVAQPLRSHDASADVLDVDGRGDVAVERHVAVAVEAGDAGAL